MGDIGMRTVGWGLWDGAVGWGQCMHSFCEETSRFTWIMKSLSDPLQGLHWHWEKNLRRDGQFLG